MRRRWRMAATIGVVASCLAITAVPGSAAVSDPEDTRGPLDLRWVNLDRAPVDRLRLTFSFWPGFKAGALAGDFREGLLVKFRLPSLGETATGYTAFRDGHLRFIHGDFGSSACCYRARLRRIDRRTLTTIFLPWWERAGVSDDGLRYRARTRICRARCLVDRTGSEAVSTPRPVSAVVLRRAV